MKKFKICIANDWVSDKQAHYLNKDGFLKALHILREKEGWDTVFIKKSSPGSFDHEYVKFKYVEDVKQGILAEKPDAILFFGDLSRPILGEFEDSKIPIAVAMSGGTFNEYVHVPDIMFVESQVYVDLFKGDAKKVVRAFGTNTTVFKPTKQPKIWDAVFPATFASWKRHDLFAEAMGKNGLACGWFQPNEPQCWEVCQEKGTALLHHQNAESVNLIYNMGKTCVITSNAQGGSQRTVLEAMACNVPVITMSDSDKTTPFIEECGIGGIVEPDAMKIREVVWDWMNRKVDTRDWVMENYSEEIYANQLKEGILSIC